MQTQNLKKMKDKLFLLASLAFILSCSTPKNFYSDNLPASLQTTETGSSKTESMPDEPGALAIQVPEQNSPTPPVDLEASASPTTPIVFKSFPAQQYEKKKQTVAKPKKIGLVKTFKEIKALKKQLKQSQEEPEKKKNKWATIGFILAIIALPISAYSLISGAFILEPAILIISALINIPALIYSIIGTKRAKEYGKKGLSTAGIVISALNFVPLILAILYVIYFLILFLKLLFSL